MSEKKPSGADTDAKTKFIVPPGLISKVISFKSHVKVSRGRPILVVGATGVGKSLFLNIFEKLQIRENPKAPIIWANCAHFGGPGSDPNIARSELFGLNPKILGKKIKGVSEEKNPKKDNKNNIVGLVEKANGGTLILEEIGELPLVVQAMLLTFIETGKYRPTGETLGDVRFANVSIIGATNRENELREDFRYRFSPFYIPSIYERREDILYYLHNKYPSVVKTLTPFETLCLLSHNWPGNVREIERVGMLIERRRNLPRNMPWSTGEEELMAHDPIRFMTFDPRDTGLNAKKISCFHEDMRRSGFDTKHFKSLLRQFGIGFSEDNKTSPFKSLPDLEKETDRNTGIEMISPTTLFGKAFIGYRILCSLLFQNPDSDYNPFDSKEEQTFEYYYDESIYHGIDNKTYKLYQQLMVSTFNYLSGLKLQKDITIPFEYDKRYLLFKELATNYPSNKFLASFIEINRSEISNEVTSPDIFAMQYNDFMKYYITGLIDRANGNATEAARMIGMKYQTLKTKQKKYNAF